MASLFNRNRKNLSRWLASSFWSVLSAKERTPWLFGLIHWGRVIRIVALHRISQVIKCAFYRYVMKISKKRVCLKTADHRRSSIERWKYYLKAVYVNNSDLSHSVLRLVYSICCDLRFLGRRKKATVKYPFHRQLSFALNCMPVTTAEAAW